MSDPRPSKAPKVLTIIGLVVFFAGVIVARVLRRDDPELATDVGDTIKTLGTVLASLGGSLPIPELLRRALGTGGSKVLMALLIGGVLTAGSALPGCGGSQYVARERAYVEWKQGPPCWFAVRLDDEKAEPSVTVKAPLACPAKQVNP